MRNLVQAKMAKLESKRRSMAKSRLVSKQLTDESALQASPPLSEEAKVEHNRNFEKACEDISHSHCKCCRGIGLNFKVNKNGFCEKCKTKKDKEEYLHGGMLPVWYDANGTPQFRVPHQLSRLSHAEKILIQRCSPFVALHHIKNGTFGLTGHVCCFEQDIEGFVQKLPRLPHDATVLKVVRAMKTEVGGCKESSNKAYRVRKKEVLEALQWLQIHHKDYGNVKIEMDRLNWIEGVEGTLDGLAVEHRPLNPKEHEHRQSVLDNDTSEGEGGDAVGDASMLDRNQDLGPSVTQTLGATPGDNIAQYGYIDVGGRSALSKEDQEINALLRESVGKSPNRRDIVFDFPEEKSIPVSEYGAYRIFTNAFPWLFPGGIGDVKDFNGKEGRNLCWQL